MSSQESKDAPFDPAEFRKQFEDHKSDHGFLKDLRIQVQRGTFVACRSGQYTLPDGTIVTLNKGDLENASRGTRYYGDEISLNLPSDQSRKFETRFRVIEGDCLEAALWLQRTTSSKTAILNMANQYVPGGGYRFGCSAQEENIHRRTSCYQCLEDPERIDSGRSWKYPMTDYGGIYSPDVAVFRGSEADGYPFFPQPEKIGVITVAAYDHPQTYRDAKGNKWLTTEEEEGTIRKILAILNIAFSNGHTAITLSAFGCGAFANPPQHMAKLFHNALVNEFRGCFEHVIFAIFNNSAATTPGGNVLPFAQEFNVPVEQIAQLQQ